MTCIHVVCECLLARLVMLMMLQICLSDIGEIFKVRLELSPMKQSQEPEWKIKTVIFFFFFLLTKSSIFYKAVGLLCNDFILSYVRIVDYGREPTNERNTMNIRQLSIDNWAKSKECGCLIAVYSHDAHSKAPFTINTKDCQRYRQQQQPIVCLALLDSGTPSTPEQTKTVVRIQNYRNKSFSLLTILRSISQHVGPHK